MRYSNNRDTNEMEHRINGAREIVSSGDLELFLGDDNYTNEIEEMLLYILNNKYSVNDAVNNIREYVKRELVNSTLEEIIKVINKE